MLHRSASPLQVTSPPEAISSQVELFATPSPDPDAIENFRLRPAQVYADEAERARLAFIEARCGTLRRGNSAEIALERITSPTGKSFRERLRLRASRITQLDEEENSVETPRVPTPSQLLLFKGMERERSDGRAALVIAGEAPAIVAAYDACCNSGMIQYSPELKRHRVLTNTCKNRLCPRCGRLRRHDYALKLEEAIGPVRPNQWRFFTLTLKSSDVPLADQLDHLQASYRRLRQQTIWKRNVERAKGVIEVTWNDETEMWHPHLHIVAEGRFIAKEKLSFAWEKASQGSIIVDIRALDGTGKAVRYLCKYLGKTPDLRSARDPLIKLAEFYDAIKGRKMILHSGTWPDIEEPEITEDPAEASATWQTVGTVAELFAAARGGHEWAKAILRELAAGDKAKLDPTDDG